MHRAVERRVIAADVIAQLLDVRPIDLTGGRKVVRRITLERLCLVDVRQHEQVVPVFARQLLLSIRNRIRIVDRLITGEDAMPEKFVRLRIDGELKITIGESRTDSIVEAADDVVDVADLDDTPQFAPRHQP